MTVSSKRVSHNTMTVSRFRMPSWSLHRSTARTEHAAERGILRRVTSLHFPGNEVTIPTASRVHHACPWHGVKSILSILYPYEKQYGDKTINLLYPANVVQKPNKTEDHTFTRNVYPTVVRKQIFYMQTRTDDSLALSTKNSLTAPKL